MSLTSDPLSLLCHCLGLVASPSLFPQNDSHDPLYATPTTLRTWLTPPLHFYPFSLPFYDYLRLISCFSARDFAHIFSPQLPKLQSIFSHSSRVENEIPLLTGAFTHALLVPALPAELVQQSRISLSLNSTFLLMRRPAAARIHCIAIVFDVTRHRKGIVYTLDDGSGPIKAMLHIYQGVQQQQQQQHQSSAALVRSCNQFLDDDRRFRFRQQLREEQEISNLEVSNPNSSLLPDADITKMTIPAISSKDPPPPVADPSITFAIGSIVSVHGHYAPSSLLDYHFIIESIKVLDHVSIPCQSSHACTLSTSLPLAECTATPTVPLSAALRSATSLFTVKGIHHELPLSLQESQLPSDTCSLFFVDLASLTNTQENIFHDIFLPHICSMQGIAFAPTQATPMVTSPSSLSLPCGLLSYVVSPSHPTLAAAHATAASTQLFQKKDKSGGVFPNIHATTFSQSSMFSSKFMGGNHTAATAMTIPALTSGLTDALQSPLLHVQHEIQQSIIRVFLLLWTSYLSHFYTMQTIQQKENIECFDCYVVPVAADNKSPRSLQASFLQSTQPQQDNAYSQLFSSSQYFFAPSTTQCDSFVHNDSTHLSSNDWFRAPHKSNQVAPRRPDIITHTNILSLPCVDGQGHVERIILDSSALDNQAANLSSSTQSVTLRFTGCACFGVSAGRCADCKRCLGCGCTLWRWAHDLPNLTTSNYGSSSFKHRAHVTLLGVKLKQSKAHNAAQGQLSSQISPPLPPDDNVPSESVLMQATAPPPHPYDKELESLALVTLHLSILFACPKLAPALQDLLDITLTDYRRKFPDNQSASPKVVNMPCMICWLKKTHEMHKLNELRRGELAACMSSFLHHVVQAVQEKQLFPTSFAKSLQQSVLLRCCWHPSIHQPVDLVTYLTSSYIKKSVISTIQHAKSYLSSSFDSLQPPQQLDSSQFPGQHFPFDGANYGRHRVDDTRAKNSTEQIMIEHLPTTHQVDVSSSSSSSLSSHSKLYTTTKKLKTINLPWTICFPHDTHSVDFWVLSVLRSHYFRFLEVLQMSRDSAMAIHRKAHALASTSANYFALLLNTNNTPQHWLSVSFPHDLLSDGDSFNLFSHGQQPSFSCRDGCNIPYLPFVDPEAMVSINFIEMLWLQLFAQDQTNSHNVFSISQYELQSHVPQVIPASPSQHDQFDQNPSLIGLRVARLTLLHQSIQRILSQHTAILGSVCRGGRSQQRFLGFYPINDSTEYT